MTGPLDALMNWAESKGGDVFAYFTLMAVMSSLLFGFLVWLWFFLVMLGGILRLMGLTCGA